MKRRIKTEAELEKLLSLPDGISDEYLAEALSLHEKITDERSAAKAPRLNFKPLAVIAACLLIVAALAPLSFILSMTLGGGCGASGGFDEPTDGNMSSGGEYGDKLDGSENGGVPHRVGDCWQTASGDITYLSLDGAVLTLIIRGDVEYGAATLVSGKRGDTEYYSQHSYPNADEMGTHIDGGVTLTVISTEQDGTARVEIDLTGFVEATGLEPSELTVRLRGFGMLELTK